VYHAAPARALKEVGAETKAGADVVAVETVEFVRNPAEHALTKVRA
jgi:hypothetical protein